MSISEDILKVLTEPRFRHNGLWVNLVGFPVFGFKNKKSIVNALSYLRSKDYITIEADHIKVSSNGKEYLARKQAMLRVFKSPFSKNAPKNLLVLFDIPEKRKPEREWFRRQLIDFGYNMVQKSVWLGPSPLPKEFVDYVKKIGLKDGIKTFKLAKGIKLE
ncbi:MAG: CRISPR-associated endonuclease Cas2 [Patescibacteria group bacterium]